MSVTIIAPQAVQWNSEIIVLPELIAEPAWNPDTCEYEAADSDGLHYYGETREQCRLAFDAELARLADAARRGNIEAVLYRGQVYDWADIRESSTPQ